MKVRQLLREEWVLALCVFLVSVFYLVQFRGFLDRGGIEDEGAFLDILQRIHYGELIYQDFFIFIPPLSFIIPLSFIFPIFGMTLSVVNITTAILGGCIAFLTYIMSRFLITRPLLALFPPFLFIFFGFHHWNALSHHWFGLTFFLSGLYCLCAYIRNPLKPCLILLSGVLGGLCLLSIQIDGVIYFVSCVIFLLFRRGRSTPHCFRDVVRFGAGVGACLAAFLIYAFLQGRMFHGYTSYPALLKTFGYDTLVWTITAHRKWNALPQYYYYGNQMMAECLRQMISPASLTGFLIPFVDLLIYSLFGYAAFPALLFSAWTLIVQRKTFGTSERTVLLYSLTCLLFLVGAMMTRPDPLRLILFSPITFILFFALLEKGLMISPYRKVFGHPPKADGGRWNMPPIVRRGITGGVVFLLLVLGIATVVRGVFWTYSLSKEPGFEVKIPRGTIIFRDRLQAADFSSLVRFVNTHTKEGEYLYIHGFSPQYYFLLNRRNPTPYDFLIPVYSTPFQISEGVSQIKVKKPRYVLYDGKIENIMKNPFGGGYAPTLTAEDVKDNPMVEYIHSHYLPIMRFPSLGLAILERHLQ